MSLNNSSRKLIQSLLSSLLSSPVRRDQPYSWDFPRQHSLPTFSPIATQCVRQFVPIFCAEKHNHCILNHYENKKFSSFVGSLFLTYNYERNYSMNLPLDKHYIICQVKRERSLFKNIFPLSFPKNFSKKKMCSIVLCSIDTTQNTLVVGTKIWQVLVRIWFYLKYMIASYFLNCI